MDYYGWMDYRALLKKYMDNVGQEEGVTFLPSISGWSNVRFSEEEEDELVLIDAEIGQERSDLKV